MGELERAGGLAMEGIVETQETGALLQSDDIEYFYFPEHLHQAHAGCNIDPLRGLGMQIGGYPQLTALIPPSDEDGFLVDGIVEAVDPVELMKLGMLQRRFHGLGPRVSEDGDIMLPCPAEHHVV